MLRSKRFPPGPPGSAIFGHFKEYSRDPLGFITRCSREYGDVAAFRLPGMRVYLVNHPDEIGKVFAATNSKFVNHVGVHAPLSRMLFGGGMLTSEGDEWRRQRDLTFPKFRHSEIAKYVGIMIDEARQTLDRWRAGAVLDIFHEMTGLTLRVFLRTLFCTANARNLDDITRPFFALSGGFLLKRRLQSLDVALRTPVRRQYREQVELLNAAVSRIVDERLRDGIEHDDLLDVLLTATYSDGSRVSREQLLGEIKTFLFNGVFGTGLPLAWAFHLIAGEKAVAERIAHETEDLTEISWTTDLRQCKFASWVLKEAMRLYPPIWASGREACVDTEIGGYSVPRGTQIVMSQWIMQRDPRYWMDPESFDPERWAITNGRPRYAYFPHGGGPRFCMGDAFAEMLSVIVLSLTAQRYEITQASDADIGLIPSYALFPGRKVEVTLQPRVTRSA
jgi:cytochrome P450